jgi:hypothetical protein
LNRFGFIPEPLKISSLKMSTPTIEGLTKLLKRKGLNNLITELENDPECFEDWKKRTKEDWEKYFGLAGIDIYNYLNPRREGNEVFI